MSITIDATVGGASSNSFVLETEFIAFLATRLNVPVGSSVSGATCTEDEKKALIEATRDISAVVYQGFRASDTQMLAWPRFQAPNPDVSGSTSFASYYVYFLQDVIPLRVKDATKELALEFLRAGTTDIASTDRNAGVIEKSIAGAITTRWQPGQRPKGLGRYPRVLQLLEPLLAIGTGQVRLAR